MTIKASRHSTLILAAGFLVCFAGALPVTATGAESSGAESSSATASKSETATPGKSVRHATRHWKRHAHRKYTRTASKSSESRKGSEKDVADTVNSMAEIPASVANANAQMPSADALADSASAMTAKANTMLLASADQPADPQAAEDAPVSASDQLNDLDRALQETTPARQTLAMVSAAKPVAAAAALAPADDSASWDMTSLIGKIFIAFGAMLTLASAARMLMA